MSEKIIATITTYRQVSEYDYVPHRISKEFTYTTKLSEIKEWALSTKEFEEKDWHINRVQLSDKIEEIETIEVIDPDALPF